jgi:uncharacterized membrane protein YhaH (DUF805 family)
MKKLMKRFKDTGKVNVSELLLVIEKLDKRVKFTEYIIWVIMISEVLIYFLETSN